MICPDCVQGLPRFEHFCKGCGHPTSVDTAHCKHCDDKLKGIDFYYTDYIYIDAVKAMIHEIKFNWRWRGASQLSQLLVASGVDFASYDRVVPIPYHILRRFVRYRQPVELLMKGILSITPDIAHDRALYRIKNTVYQARLSRRQRIKNVKNIFALKGGVSGERILLVDDILTTGATVSEAAKVLKRAGAAKVDLYTFAAGMVR
jgi:ComF family protein